MGWFRAIYRLDYMGNKKWCLAISGSIIGLGLLVMILRGGGNPLDSLKWGLDFKGGTRVTVVLAEEAQIDDVRRVVTDAGYPNAVIQEFTTPSGDKAFHIQTEALDRDEEAALKATLEEEWGIATTAEGQSDFSSQTIGAAFGRQIISASWKAGLVAIVLIIIYVSIRFEWKFAVGALAAEIHDLLVVICVYAVVGREITTATLAAVLTIVGYSLYDTIIVFDRIRENAPKLPGATYGDMVNRSIWETMTRSLNTTLLMLLPVTCLLLFGGFTLRDFAFALFVGTISGAYSSFLVASPVVTVLKEREPRYRRLAARAE